MKNLISGKINMKEAPRKPNVVLASFPRSGNTFLRNILIDVAGIYSWNNIKVYNKALKELGRLETVKKLHVLNKPRERKLIKLREQMSYRVIKTHEVPKKILPQCAKDTRIIYLVRDGRDALVSMAHHRKDIVEPGTDFIKNLKEAIRAPMGTYFGGWGKNVSQWNEIADLVIHFENLVSNPEEEIMRLKEVLDFPKMNMEKIPTFDSQRDGGSHFGGKKRDKLSKEEQDQFNSKFFRSGGAGYWEDEKPPELQEKFWKKYGDVMLQMGYMEDGSLKTI